MEHSNSSVGGKPRYQSEPLIARLKNIIRDYPEGFGIIKELIQNADDALATRVEITLDWRTHQPSQLPDSRMLKLMGPAMLVYNDRVFTDRDFESICSLGQSGKAQVLQKTGRFGVGFNAVYHVTDYPSFISRDRLICFDPHGAAIPGTSRQEPGREWSFAEAGWYSKYPDFMKVYEAGGLPPKVKDFKGTLLRLPLRTEADALHSEIRKQAFSEKNVEELLEELIQSGEELLIFLKSVQEICVYKIPADSDGTRQETLTILTKNKKEVGEARKKLLDALPDDPVTLISLCRKNLTDIASVSYRHEIETITPERTTNATWRVVSIIGSDVKSELAQAIEQMHQQEEKAVPWAGAAARITPASTDGNPKGRAYCFLPTAIETGLPIHINGFFNLNSSRDNLISDSGQTGKDRLKPIWNQLLVRHVLSVACAKLMADLLQDIGKRNHLEFYQLWPVSKTVSKALEELPRCVIQLLSQMRVVRSAVDHIGIELQYDKTVICSTKWVTPTTVKVLPSKKWWEDCSAPLSADKIDIPDPVLPDWILTAFRDAGCGLETFTAAKLREHLKQNQPLGVPLEEAPLPSLRNRQWVVNMLRYCISDGHKDLRGLPLAILANNTLQVFGHNPIGTIYMANEETRQIFANHSEWFLHPNLYSQVPEVGNRIGVLNMDATEVAKRLVDVIGSTQSAVHKWQPDAPNPPNATWLSQVYTYFAKVSQLPRREIEAVPMVPGNDGKLYKGGLVDTPLLCTSDIDEETVAAVQYFGVTLVQAPPTLLDAIAQFVNRHPGQLIWFLTGPDVLDTLYSAKGRLPRYESRLYTSLLNFLADPLWLTGQKAYDQDRQNKLRQLPIYQTTVNEPVTLNDEDVYIPGGGYEPPEIAASLKLLRLGTAKQEWFPLFRLLKVPVLNRARLIRDCLLREYKLLAREQQRTALAWIRDNLSDARADLEKENQSFDALKQEIKNAPLVLCTDEQLRQASLVYSPESDVVRNILGNRAAIPDLTFYSNDAALWLNFFDSLGMRKTPSADDLLAYVDVLIQRVSQSGTDAVADSCISVFNHIDEHWEELKNALIASENKTLPEALKNRAWLPVKGSTQIKQYPGAMTPEARLYRTSEVCFIQDAYLVASKRPIFERKRALPKVEIRNALGFTPVAPKMVLDHFDTLIRGLKITPITSMPDANSASLQKSVNDIYEYIYNNFVERNADVEQQRRVKRDFENRECLWDGTTGKFWQPRHTCWEDVSFFGSRRVRINNLSHHTSEVYQLLGQRRSPNVDDYLDFLQELATEYNSTLLSEEDKNYALQVLQRLESQLSLEKRSVENILLLTDDGQLRLANEVLIPDAPWRKPYIDPNRVLHPQVSSNLAKSAGSLSLLRDVIERPTEDNTASNPNVNEPCQQWQNTLNSEEFIFGLKRLIFHEHDFELVEDIKWLTQANISPASQIRVDLFLDDNTKIASAVPGDYYFDKEGKIFYVNCSSSRYTMVGYLAESLNNQLGKYALKNLLPLTRIIDEAPRNIRSLLNELRIRSLTVGENEPIEIVGTPPSEKTTPDIPSENKTDVVKSENPYPWGQFGERWARLFYNSLGYTSIEKKDDWVGFDFLCTGSELPKIQSEVKAITFNRPNIRITRNEWSKMVNLGEKYELLIVSHQGETVYEVIQISNLWTTLIYAFSQLEYRSRTTVAYEAQSAEVLFGFHSNSDNQCNDVILSWHRLIQCVPYENIKKYRPTPSRVSYEDEPVKFERK